MMSDAARTPVLVGIGLATRREDDARLALEPMDLMLEAALAAGHDSGSRAALAGAQYIAVPRGRWTYRNPAGEIARRIGAASASTVLSSVGVLQQTLLGEACARIARGEAHTTLVTGADAGYRLLRAQLADVHLKAPGRNYLYIRLFLSGRCGVAFLGNSPAIAGETRLAATTQEHPRCGQDNFDQGP